jgi:hypothetical protein
LTVLVLVIGCLTMVTGWHVLQSSPFGLGDGFMSLFPAAGRSQKVSYLVPSRSVVQSVRVPPSFEEVPHAPLGCDSGPTSRCFVRDARQRFLESEDGAQKVRGWAESMAPHGLAFFHSSGKGHLACFSERGTEVVVFFYPRVINARLNDGGYHLGAGQTPRYSGVTMAVEGLDVTCGSYQAGIAEDAIQLARSQGAYGGKAVGVWMLSSTPNA